MCRPTLRSSPCGKRAERVCRPVQRSGSPLLFATVRYLHEPLPLSRWRDITADRAVWKDPPRQGAASERYPDAATGASPVRALAQTCRTCSLLLDRDRLRLTEYATEARGGAGCGKQPSDVQAWRSSLGSSLCSRKNPMADSRAFRISEGTSASWSNWRTTARATQ